MITKLKFISSNKFKDRKFTVLLEEAEMLFNYINKMLFIYINKQTFNYYY